MEWNPTLEHLAEKSRLVSKMGPYYNCYLLKILLALEVAECLEFDAGRIAQGVLVRRLVERTGLVERTVSRYFDLTISRDLNDWRDEYSNAVHSYRTSRWKDTDFVRNLEYSPPGMPPPDKYFVLRDQLWIWQPEIPGIGPQYLEEADPAEQFVVALYGYLIAHGNFYWTTVHMLEASSKERWKRWEALWELL